MFFSEGQTKVIISTGFYISTRNSEIFDLSSGSAVQCTIQPFPIDQLFGASGGVVDGTPLICAGYGIINGQFLYSTTCHSLNPQGHWIEDQAIALTQGRMYSGSVVMQSQLLMVGGYDGSSVFKTILSIKPNTGASILSIQLPHGLYSTCVVAWNATTFLVTGGWSDQSNSEQGTYFVNVDENRVTPGPPMQNGRSFHGCQEIKIQGNSYIIVGGGWNGAKMKSTEKLDKSHADHGWTLSKHNPKIFFQ